MSTATRKAPQPEPSAGPMRQKISLAISGSGGAGVITAGEMLLNAAAAAGWYGLMTRSTGPQIRGGEAAALLTLSSTPVGLHNPQFDILVAVDWLNTDRFAAELTLRPESLVVGDSALPDDAPTFAVESGAERADLPLKELAKTIEGGRINMVALGCVAELLSIPAAALDKAVRGKLASKGDAAIASSLACIQAGAAAIAETASADAAARFALEPSGERKERWLISGNEAAGLGAVRGGVRFAAAYPITPATEVLEWLAPALDQVGGSLVQAEDELASINMIIGASYGGVPSITATSGPGLALMIESIGLATSSEVPVVIVNVMRGGPSTGIPTKSEQSDLNIALYGLHGDAPHVVVAPSSIGDCLFTTQWAVHLAEDMQAPAIVLSDQFLGQAKAVVDPPANVSFITKRVTADTPEPGYSRYAVTDSGVSPMSIPGTKGGQYTADGLEHSPQGTPSSRVEDHVDQLAKRRRKIEGFDYGDHWATAEGEGNVAVLCWGSTSEAVRLGAELAREEGIGVRNINLRLLLPAQPDRLAELLKDVDAVVVVEQSEGAQFYRYLRAHYDLPGRVYSLHQPGPLPFQADDVLQQIRKAISS
jgi:2-oxoglutarate ferredoxin oxidoreductase subunit alpha